MLEANADNNGMYVKSYDLTKMNKYTFVFDDREHLDRVVVKAAEN